MVPKHVQRDMPKSTGLELAPGGERGPQDFFLLFSTDGVFARKCHFQEPKLSVDSSQV